jgi:hypothetical protein
MAGLKSLYDMARSGAGVLPVRDADGAIPRRVTLGGLTWPMLGLGGTPMRRMFSLWDSYRAWVEEFDAGLSQWWLRWSIALLVAILATMWGQFALWCLRGCRPEPYPMGQHPGYLNSVRAWEEARASAVTDR